jgi:hypothetical protein
MRALEELLDGAIAVSHAGGFPAVGLEVDQERLDVLSRQCPYIHWHAGARHELGELLDSLAIGEQRRCALVLS